MRDKFKKISFLLSTLAVIIFIAVCGGMNSDVTVYAADDDIQTVTGEAGIIWEGVYPDNTETVFYADANWENAKKALAAGMAKAQYNIDLSSYKLSTNVASKLYAETVNEHPEFFYVGGSYSMSYYTASGIISSITPYYAGTTSEIAEMKKEFQAEVDNCVEYVKTRTTSGKTLSDVEIALQVNDYIATHTTYKDNNTKSCHTAYSILVNGYGVCDGYAGAFLYLCDYMFGIDTKMVLSAGMGHAWNMIKVDGSWYHVDVCWNDPVFSYGSTVYEYYVSHDYFLCSDTAFKNNLGHTSWNDNGITCTSTKYDKKFGKGSSAKNTGLNVLWGDYWYYYNRSNNSFYRYKTGVYAPEYVSTVPSGAIDAIYAGDVIYFTTGSKIYECDTDGTDSRLFSTLDYEANSIGFEGNKLTFGTRKGAVYGFLTSDVEIKILGQWKKYGTKWYYNQENKWLTGWLKVGKDWFYLNPSDEGAMVSGWKKISNKWFYFNGDGIMQTGWTKVSGKWYYMNGDGVMQTGWTKVSGKWYYMNGDGIMQTGWTKVSGKWYYMNGDGVMQTGWTKVSGKWYYMNGDGVMQTGWKKISNKWYYMNGDGVMQTGWKTLSGKSYYLYSDGHMATNTWIGNYYVDGNGVWTKTK